jgi:hypothetical protein
MNPSNPSAPGNEITRRNFMKKSALTVGAITVLGQGTGLASGSSRNVHFFWDANGDGKCDRCGSTTPGIHATF